MVAILFNNEEPFEEIDNIPSTENPTLNLAKNGQAVSENKLLKNFEIFYMYKAQWQVQLTPWDRSLIITKRVCFFDHTL